jgi:hypothetical protein
MKIKNWTACVQDRGKWKEVVKTAKTFNQKVQRLEEEAEEEVTTVLNQKNSASRLINPAP